MNDRATNLPKRVLSPGNPKQRENPAIALLYLIPLPTGLTVLFGGLGFFVFHFDHS